MTQSLGLDALWSALPALIGLPLLGGAAIALDPTLTFAALAVLLGSLAVALAWCWFSRVVRPIRRLGPSSALTDAELTQLIGQLEGQADLLPAVWARRRGLHDGSVLLGFGLVDEVGDLFVPSELDPAGCMTRAEVELDAALPR